jgi:hypothetical protein
MHKLELAQVAIVIPIRHVVRVNELNSLNPLTHLIGWKMYFYRNKV